MENIRVSAKAIIIQDGKLLAMQHRSLTGDDYYILPGGGQQNGETLAEAVQRECLEEAGVVVVVKNVVYIRDYIEANHEFAGQTPGFHQVEVIFACEIVDARLLGQGHELDTRQVGVAWIPLVDLLAYPLYPKILREVLPLNDAPIYLGDVN